MLLDFGEELEQKPVHPESLPRGGSRAGSAAGEAAAGTARLGQFRTSSGHHAGLRVERQKSGACPCCGGERQEIGAEESWQIEYLPGHFERIQHVRKKYACAHCEAAGEKPQIEVAARAEAAIESGLAGPGLLAYIVTSKFADYLAAVPAGRYFRAAGIRDFAGHAVGVVRRCGRSGRALVPADGGAGAGIARGGHRRHRAAHAERGKTQSARMWVYVGDADKSLQRFRLHLEPRPRRAATVSERLHRGAAGRCLRRLQRRGGGQRHHARRMLVACAAEVRRGGENGAGDRSRGRRLMRPLFAVEKQAKEFSVAERLASAPGAIGAAAGRTATEVAGLERTIAAQASHGGSGELHAGPMGRTQRLLLRMAPCPSITM